MYVVKSKNEATFGEQALQGRTAFDSSEFTQYFSQQNSSHKTFTESNFDAKNANTVKSVYQWVHIFKRNRMFGKIKDSNK